MRDEIFRRGGMRLGGVAQLDPYLDARRYAAAAAAAGPLPSPYAGKLSNSISIFGDQTATIARGGKALVITRFVDVFFQLKIKGDSI